MSDPSPTRTPESKPRAWHRKLAKAILWEMGRVVAPQEEAAALDNCALLIARADPSTGLRAAAEEALPWLGEACESTPDGMNCRACNAQEKLRTALAATAAPPCPSCARLREALPSVWLLRTAAELVDSYYRDHLSKIAAGDKGPTESPRVVELRAAADRIAALAGAEAGGEDEPCPG